MQLERDDLPTSWLGASKLGQMYFDMPFPLHRTTWCRLKEDFGRGWPAVHVELAWIEEDERALHFATCAGFTLAEETDGVDEREVLDQRRIPLVNITGIDFDLSPARNHVVHLSTGEAHHDWPTDLIAGHRHHHPEDYRF